jgi:hypothetical protein
MPLAVEVIRAPLGIHSAAASAVPRMYAEGTTNRITSASRNASAMSFVNEIAGGISKPGR